MLRAAIVIALLIPLHVYAQTGHDHHSREGAAAPGGRISPSGPTQPGQAAFAAIQEIVKSWMPIRRRTGAR